MHRLIHKEKEVQTLLDQLDPPRDDVKQLFGRLHIAHPERERSRYVTLLEENTRLRAQVNPSYRGVGDS
jgi:hypothetical protein